MKPTRTLAARRGAAIDTRGTRTLAKANARVEAFLEGMACSTKRQQKSRGMAASAPHPSLQLMDATRPQCLRQVSAFFQVHVSRPVWMTGGTVLPSARSRMTMADR